MIAPHDLRMARCPIHAVDFTIVTETREDFTAIIGNTLFVDVMPGDSCMLADISYCEGREVTITFDNADAAQSFRARALWNRLKALEYPPTIITANTPKETFMYFTAQKRLVRARVFEEKK